MLYAPNTCVCDMCLGFASEKKKCSNLKFIGYKYKIKLTYSEDSWGTSEPIFMALIGGSNVCILIKVY